MASVCYGVYERLNACEMGYGCDREIRGVWRVGVGVIATCQVYMCVGMYMCLRVCVCKVCVPKNKAR